MKMDQKLNPKEEQGVELTKAESGKFHLMEKDKKVASDDPKEDLTNQCEYGADEDNKTLLSSSEVLVQKESLSVTCDDPVQLSIENHSLPFAMQPLSQLSISANSSIQDPSTRILELLNQRLQHPKFEGLAPLRDDQNQLAHLVQTCYQEKLERQQRDKLEKRKREIQAGRKALSVWYVYVFIHALTSVLETLAIEYKSLATWCLVGCIVFGIIGVVTINKLARMENTHAAHLECLAFVLNYGLSYPILLIKSVDAWEKNFGLKEGYEHVFVVTQCIVLIAVNVIRSFAMRSALHHYTPQPNPHAE